MTHIMLDLETLSSAPDAAIVAIGAVTFGALSGARATFYQPIRPGSNGEISAETVQWWARQSDKARAVLNDETAVELPSALRNFRDWLRAAAPTSAQIWGNGSDFDNVVLRRAYERCYIPAPWSHRENRCYRTLKNLRPDIPFESYGTAHNALDDAVSQANHAQKIISAIERREIAA